MVSLDDLIRKAQEMKPLPPSAVRLAGLVSSGQTDLDDICDIITYDQALTLALLRAANSAAVAGHNRISEVHEAVFRLGAARILALIMSATTSNFLKQGAPAYGLSEGALWKHSVASAAAAETLSKFTDMELPPETFTAALLHDLGKLVMSRYLSASDLEMIHRAQNEGGLDPLAAESQILGVHHGELGGLIVQHWRLPERIIKGIIYHHTPADGNDLACDAVHLANWVAKQIEPTPSPAKPDAEALGRLGLEEGRLDELIASARDHFEMVRAAYNTV